MNKKRILLICTGGTIASTLKKDGYAPGLTDSDILEYIPSVREFCDVDTVQVCNIDSTNMTPWHWSLVTKEIKKRAKQPVIMKLSPNVTDIKVMAKAAVAGGADALSLINTLTGMKINVHTRKFALANKTGGVSGPAIHPIAVRMVYEVANCVDVPIIGMGGIASAEDAIEMILAGATGISVGTANFHNPMVTMEIVDGIEAYMKRYGVKDIKELIGAVHQ